MRKTTLITTLFCSMAFPGSLRFQHEGSQRLLVNNGSVASAEDIHSRSTPVPAAPMLSGPLVTKNEALTNLASASMTVRAQTEAEGRTTASQTWEYEVVTANSPEKLLAGIRRLGAERWELVVVAIDTNRSDRYVAYLERAGK